MDFNKHDNFQMLSQLVAEANELSQRSSLTKQQEKRYDFCLAGISLLKSGAANAEEFRRANINAKLIEAGERRVAFTDPTLPIERRKLLDAYRQIARGVELRVLEAGNGTVTHTALSGGGAFVPIEYFNGEFQHAVATIDPLFDKNVVTYLETESGATAALPLTNDTDTDAVVITENTKDSATDLGAITQALTDTFSYRTPKIFTSIEFNQDGLADYNVNLLERFFVERIARGVGEDLIVGNGSGKPKGLVPSLEAVGVIPVTAQGSSGNDGITGNNGSNSIGSDDLSALFTSVQARYRSSPKAAWLFNDNTFQFLAGLKNKFGGLVFDELRLEKPTLFGKPVYVSPSIANIGAGNIPVVFGDLSHWLTRHVKDSSYVRNYREIPGAVEYGVTAWAAFARYGGQLLMSNGTRPAINYIINHT